jgi:hypothetical protein
MIQLRLTWLNDIIERAIEHTLNTDGATAYLVAGICS